MSQMVIDPVTHDYVMGSTGKPVETEELTAPAYIRLRTPRGKWLYAPDQSYGSDLALIKKLRTTDPSGVENVAALALQPIVDDGRADQIDVTATSVQRNSLGLQINITDAVGAPQKITLDSIGK